MLTTPLPLPPSPPSSPPPSWFAPAPISAGFIAVLVGYTSSAAIVFQAAHAAGASAAQIASWLLVLGLGMGLTCIGLSLYFRSPILTAWSTPGAALLTTSLVGVPMGEAVGAFMFSSALLTLAGLTGGFERLMRYLPKALAAAMLAGVLLRFGLATFTALPEQGGLVGTMIGVFLLARRMQSRYTLPLTLLAGLGMAWAQGSIQGGALTLALAHPVWTTPVFSPATVLGVGVPLCVVTMASQHVPGLAVLRANGYTTPVSPLVSVTGLTGVVLAPFGGFAFNLAAITAAICMSREASPDPVWRYRAAVWAGGFYVLTGLFGATVVSLFTALPLALVQAIAGLALLGTLANSLFAALHEEPLRESAILTFLVTASGMTLFGVGSAFWGLVLGGMAYALRHRPTGG